MKTAVAAATDSERHRRALALLTERVNYERTPAERYSERQFKLSRMRELLARLGDPLAKLPVVHIAGTKGKGSTAAMVASLVQAAGYRVGVYSSPHLLGVEERIAVDGRPCAPEELTSLIEQAAPAIEACDREAVGRADGEGGPTYFEILTALAAVHFRRREVDLAVFEVGLGGRLDSTNVCQPLVTAITSISFDHTKQLGNTLAAIAGEKAGIVKPRTPLVSGVTEAEPAAVIHDICQRLGAPLWQIDRDFGVRYHPPRQQDSWATVTATGLNGLDWGTIDYWRFDRGTRPVLSGLKLGMPGAHQAANAAIALRIVEELRTLGWSVPDDALRAGLPKAHCLARVQLIATQPLTVIDAAHNVASVRALVKTLAEQYGPRPSVLLFGTSADKDAAGMLAELLPYFPRVVLTRYALSPRGLPVEQLAALAARFPACEVAVCGDPADAWQRARAWAGPDDLLCVTGSFFLAAEIMQIAASSAS